jgi:TrmH family RNA methyltransferase
VSRLTFDKKKILRNINIVLVAPQISENVGLTARILKNTSFSNLSLVTPSVNKKSLEVAKRAGDLLKKAHIFSDLHTAISDSCFVFGTTRRKRKYSSIYNFNYILPQLVSLASTKKVSILFGKENFGLSKEELGLCDSIFYIPANPAFSSYNLAFSVGIVCYEIFTFLENIFSCGALDLAKRKDLQALRRFIKKALDKKFEAQVSMSLLCSLERTLKRTHLTKREVEVLKTIFIRLHQDQRSASWLDRRAITKNTTKNLT